MQIRKERKPFANLASGDVVKVGFLLEFLSGERLAFPGYLAVSLGDRLDLVR
jgi:hypothetical protein